MFENVDLGRPRIPLMLKEGDTVTIIDDDDSRIQGRVEIFEGDLIIRISSRTQEDSDK